MKKVKINNSESIIVIIFIALISCLLFSPFAVDAQAKPIEIKFGHIAPPMAHGAKFGMEPWAKMLEKATNNQIKITMYPAQSLFKAKDALRAIETGVADMGHFPLGYFTGKFNLVEVITLPMLLSTNTSESATKILYDLWNEFPELRKDFKGMKLFMLQPNDPYYFVTKDKPIRTVADIKGLKLRTIGKYPSIAVKTLGANPIMIPMPGVYESASKGVIDGGLLFDTLTLDLRMYEVFNYYNDTPIYTSIAVIAMNEEKWGSLPADVKKAIEDSLYDGAILHAKEAFDTTKAKVIAAAKKAGKKWEKVSFSPEEKKKLKELIGKPIWEAWVKDMEKKGLPGRKVLNRAIELGKKYK